MTESLKASVLSSSGQIKIHKEIRVQSKSVLTLEDCAEFVNIDDRILDDLKKIEILKAPKIGNTKTYSSSYLAKLIKDKTKKILIGDEVEFFIPNEVTLDNRAIKFNRENIEASLIEAMKSQCPKCEFEIVSLQVPILNQLKETPHHWNIKLNSGIPKGSFSIPIEITLDDLSRRLFWISGQLRVYKNVYVAKRNLNISENLQEEDLKIEKREITFINDFAAQQEDIRSVQVNRPIAAGQIIDMSSLRKSSAAHFGDTVKVTAGSEDWQISTEGLIQQNAFIGDTVKVKILRTQKLISGTLVNKSLVEVR